LLWICVVLENFHENWVRWLILFVWCFGSSLIWIWVSFYIYKRLDKHWEQIWALGIKNWDFVVNLEFFPRATCHSSPWRVTWWSWRVQQMSNSPWRVIYSSGRVALWQHTLFCVLASFSHVSVLICLLV